MIGRWATNRNRSVDPCGHREVIMAQPRRNHIARMAKGTVVFHIPTSGVIGDENNHLGTSQDTSRNGTLKFDTGSAAGAHANHHTPTVYRRLACWDSGLFAS